MKEKENTHKDHRKRLKDKVKKFGLEGLAVHEMLEYMLTYSIPRKDTNPIAHKLINHFGSFSNVVDANYYDLLKVDGVGPETALFISSLSQFFEVYHKSKADAKTIFLKSTAKCVEFFRDNYRIKDNEFMVMVCLSKTKKVIKTYLYKGVSETSVTFDLHEIANHINDKPVKSIVLFHTHPNGHVEPSIEDLKTTQSIVNVCLTHGIDIDDHIILNEGEHFSFARNGLIDKMKSKYTSMFSVNDMYFEKLLDTSLKNMQTYKNIEEDKH